MVGLAAFTFMAVGMLVQLGTAVPGKGPKPTSTEAPSQAKASSTTSSASGHCPTGYTRTATSEVATFDDTAFSTPAENGNFVPVPYKNMYFQSYAIYTVNPAPSIDVIPNSPFSYAAEGLRTQTLEGTPMMSLNYPGSTFGAFDLNSLFFGCGTSTQAVTTPQACTMTITGYQGSDNTVAGSIEVAAQTFQYNPTTSTGQQQMAFAELSSAFRDLTFATFQYTITGDAALQSILTGIIDTVRYTVYNCTN